MVSDGFIVGNHSMTHPDMSRMDMKTFKEEIEALRQSIKK
jgi:peptidoglycan/xylan/chitin deacetylase (PgdA/CDA1 family)